MGGSSSSSGVTRVEPSTVQAPYLRDAFASAQNLYNQNGRAAPVVPFSPQTETALGLQEQRALSGSPVTNAAQQYATQSLQGGFMGSNPYLDSTFNKAALATQNQLASEFARSGRNVDASEGLRSQQLNDLATGIYGGAYDAERNRMQGILPFANSLANQDYQDINALRDVGGQVEGLAGEYANASGNALDQYLARVRGTDYGSTQTSRMRGPSNGVAGALGGAALGTAIFPGVGTILGGLLGGLG